MSTNAELMNNGQSTNVCVLQVMLNIMEYAENAQKQLNQMLIKLGVFAKKLTKSSTLPNLYVNHVLLILLQMLRVMNVSATLDSLINLELASKNLYALPIQNGTIKPSHVYAQDLVKI